MHQYESRQLWTEVAAQIVTAYSKLIIEAKWYITQYKMQLDICNEMYL